MPIGLITLDVKLAGKPYAGKPHVRFDVAGVGNGVDDPLEGDTLLKGEKRLGLTRSALLPRQLPTLLYVSDLLAREIVPVMNKEYMVEVAEKRGNRFYEYVAKLNSMGPGVLDFIQSLEKLNFRKDLRFLTLQGWSNAFASKRLIRATRAWCPDCYNDWYRRKQTIYDPLIWGLQTVTICGRHQKRLTTACPHCNRELPLIGRLSLVGCCERCGGGLGL